MCEADATPNGLSPVPAGGARWKAIRAGTSSTRIAAVSIVRGLSLLLSGRPRTPLRALCIAAFDSIHTIRHGKRMPTPQLKTLATLLDFGAYANAAFDHKADCRVQRRVTLQLLEEAEIGLTVTDYLRRLSDLENGRPSPGGDRWHFQNVSSYREAVVRLSLGMIATAAGIAPGLDEGIEATHGCDDLNLLFRIAMQCQISDDVLDYSRDRSAELPSFLTACESLPQALELTRQAARDYADGRVVRSSDVFPLRAALFLVSTCTRLVVSLRRWECRRGHPRHRRRSDQSGDVL
jgi:hypothetical protein